MSEDSGTEGAERQPVGEMTDMFDGTSSPYRDPRGRKKMKITNELRDRVARLRASGMTQEQIADAIGCSVPTLAQYFSLELNEGKSAKRAEMIDALWNAGLAGNVSAMKAWLALNDRDSSHKAIVRPRAEPKLGKKEQALVDAKAAPHAGGWADVVRH
jgi:transcriptional regulator with XRE-family HTH domain